MGKPMLKNTTKNTTTITTKMPITMTITMRNTMNITRTTTTSVSTTDFQTKSNTWVKITILIQTTTTTPSSGKTKLMSMINSHQKKARKNWQHFTTKWTEWSQRTDSSQKMNLPNGSITLRRGLSTKIRSRCTNTTMSIRTVLLHGTNMLK